MVGLGGARTFVYATINQAPYSSIKIARNAKPKRNRSATQWAIIACPRAITFSETGQYGTLHVASS
jgi:hypothetical protein